MGYLFSFRVNMFSISGKRHNMKPKNEKPFSLIKFYEAIAMTWPTKVSLSNNWLSGFVFVPVGKEGSRLKLKDCHAILRVTLEIIESSKLPFQPSTSARRLAII